MQLQTDKHWILIFRKNVLKVLPLIAEYIFQEFGQLEMYIPENTMDIQQQHLLRANTR